MEIRVQADPPRPDEQLDPWGCILRFLSFVDQFCVELYYSLVRTDPWVHEGDRRLWVGLVNQQPSRTGSSDRQATRPQLLATTPPVMEWLPLGDTTDKECNFICSVASKTVWRSF